MNESRAVRKGKLYTGDRERRLVKVNAALLVQLGARTFGARLRIDTSLSRAAACGSPTHAAHFTSREGFDLVFARTMQSLSEGNAGSFSSRKQIIRSLARGPAAIRWCARAPHRATVLAGRASTLRAELDLGGQIAAAAATSGGLKRVQAQSVLLTCGPGNPCG